MNIPVHNCSGLPSYDCDALYENEIIPAVEKGLCGAIYTQLSDVEDETNGLVTYNRKHCKAEENRMRIIARKLHDAMQKSCAEDQVPAPEEYHPLQGQPDPASM